MTLVFLVVFLFSDQTPHFTNNSPVSSNTGYIKLSWKGGNEVVELQQSDNDQFDNAFTLYKGRNRSCFISGLEDGTYFFRLRAKKGEWSDRLKLIVKHHPIERAWLLFGLGAVVFMIVAGVIIRGEK